MKFTAVGLSAAPGGVDWPAPGSVSTKAGLLGSVSTSAGVWLPSSRLSAGASSTSIRHAKNASPASAASTTMPTTIETASASTIPRTIASASSTQGSHG